jgi:hypothetical protein
MNNPWRLRDVNRAALFSKNVYERRYAHAWFSHTVHRHMCDFDKSAGMRTGSYKALTMREMNIKLVWKLHLYQNHIKTLIYLLWTQARAGSGAKPKWGPRLWRSADSSVVSQTSGSADVSMEHWWNYFWKRKYMYSEKSMLQCNCVPYRYHMGCHMIEPEPPR